ncbi:MAG: hypothetical protein KAI43_05735 [Candidatus Aureabacteria bacterium]|nr:hypothetical protein [Candidatus Auribacterota bacterium]
MSVSDLKIKCEIRNILVQFWVDTTRVNISSHRGVVYLRGSIIRVKKEQSLVQATVKNERSIITTVQNIEEKIRRIRDVKRIFFDIDNLKKVGAKWQAI